MGRLSSAMKAELLRDATAVVELLTFTVAGTTYRFAEAGALDATGLYEPKVVSWGTAPRGVTSRENALELGTVDVQLDDSPSDPAVPTSGQTIAKLLEGPNRAAVQDAPASIVLASPNVSPVDWFTGYSGRLDAISQVGAYLYALTLSPNSVPLEKESSPKKTVTAGDWPSSLLAVRDADVPILYGQFNSQSQTNAGAVAALYVDQSALRYLVCAGRAKSVDAVYSGGTLKAQGTDWSTEYLTVGGRLYTVVKFTASQGTAEVTCDVRGLESVGDGSGSLITNPADVLKHYLVNWVYGDYRTGAWFADSTAPVDTTSFATASAYFTARGAEASLSIGEKIKGQDAVNALLTSFHAKAFWTADGKVGLLVSDPTAWSYPSAVIHQDDFDGLGYNYARPTAALVDRVTAKWANLPRGGYQQTLRVAALRAGKNAPETLNLSCSPAFL